MYNTEISLFSQNGVYRYFYYINDNFDNVNFIICGDFRQLAPVCDIRNYNYENSTILKQVCKYNKVELSKCRRSNRILFDLWDNVRKVKEYGFQSISRGKAKGTALNIIEYLLDCSLA